MGNVRRKKRRTGTAEYEVGYSKPPKHTRFKPGHSGNPKGRPKGVRNFKTDVRATLTAPVRLTREGRAQRISTQRAVLLRLREKALSGDARALDRLLALAGVYNNEDSPEVLRLSSNDAELLELYNARVLRGAAVTPPPASNSSESRGQMNAATSKTKPVTTSPPKRKTKRIRMKRIKP